MSEELECTVSCSSKGNQTVDLSVTVMGKKEVVKNMNKATYSTFLRDALIPMNSSISYWVVPIRKEVLLRYSFLQ
jgi:hypothetical protein